MIDGFKLKVQDTFTMQQLFHHPKLDFKTEVSYDTGAVSNIYRARYKGLRFEYINFSHRQTLFIRGSLPQYYTGLSNYTNMPLATALEAMQALVDEFELDKASTAVLSLEWGLNINLPKEISVNRLIQNLLVYKGKKPSRHSYERDGMLFLIDLNDFSIKIYNKSAQQEEYGHGNVLRYELRVKRKPQLNRMGIYSLSDLFNKQCTDKLHKKLLDTIDHLIFYDYSIEAVAIPARSKALLLEYNNPHAWSSLMQTKPEGYRKKRKSFSKQVTQVSGVDWNTLLQEGIRREAKQLLCAAVATPLLQSLSV